MTANVRTVDGPRRRIGGYVVCRDVAGRVLLVRASLGDRRTWLLPGGGLNFGEHPQVGALRELREETGYVGELDSLLGVEVLRATDSEGAPWELVQIIYRARVVGGDLTHEADGSTDLAAWIDLEQLPGLDINPVVRRALDLPAFGGSALPPYDGDPLGSSDLRGVVGLSASGIMVAEPDAPKGCAVAPGNAVRPGEDPAAAVVRAWAELGSTVTVGAARFVRSQVIDDVAAGVRRWTVRVLYDVVAGE